MLFVKTYFLIYLQRGKHKGNLAMNYCYKLGTPQRVMCVTDSSLVTSDIETRTSPIFSFFMFLEQPSCLHQA